MKDNDEKIRLLKKLIDKSSEVTVESYDDPKFRGWENLVERTFIKVFGKDSKEIEHFRHLDFFYPVMSFYGEDYSSENLENFRKSFAMLISSIEEYIEEFEEQRASNPVNEETVESVTKVFISHASEDSDIVEEVVEMLESIGLDSTQIFCTSFEGYGIALGDNYLDSLKDELSSDSLVIFVLSDEFYKSAVCLCEMGAAWVLSKEHIPVLVPPLDYKDVQGVVPLSQGLKITEPLKLNSLKEKIERDFSISNKLSPSTWERKRDRIIARIEKSISKSSGK